MSSRFREEEDDDQSADHATSAGAASNEGSSSSPEADSSCSSRSSRSDSSHSDSSRSSEERADREKQTKEEEKFELVDARLEPLQNDILHAAVTDKDTDLWLVRVPRHSSLRDDLVGSEIVVEDTDEMDTLQSLSGRKAGLFKGSYVYRDHGPADEDGPRPIFVTKDASGKAQLQIGKRISKSLSIAFDIPLKDLSGTDPLPRSYPKASSKEKGRYLPIGSTRGATLRKGQKSLRDAGNRSEGVNGKKGVVSPGSQLVTGASHGALGNQISSEPAARLELKPVPEIASQSLVGPAPAPGLSDPKIEGEVITPSATAMRATKSFKRSISRSVEHNEQSDEEAALKKRNRKKLKALRKSEKSGSGTEELQKSPRPTSKGLGDSPHGEVRKVRKGLSSEKNDRPSSSSSKKRKKRSKSEGEKSH